jgi:hypothetical protein
LCIYPFVCWWEARLIALIAIVNSFLINMSVQVSLFYVNFEFYCYILRNVTAGSYDSSIFRFRFLRNIHIAVFRDHTNLHSHQRCIRSFFPTSSPAFLVCFLDDNHSEIKS